jgi:hypothetical protein
MSYRIAAGDFDYRKPEKPDKEQFKMELDIGVSKGLHQAPKPTYKKGFRNKNPPKPKKVPEKVAKEEDEAEAEILADAEMNQGLKRLDAEEKKIAKDIRRREMKDGPKGYNNIYGAGLFAAGLAKFRRQKPMKDTE